MFHRLWFLGLVAIHLTGCGSAEQSNTQVTQALDPTQLAAEQVLHRGNGAEPQTLDPHKAEGVPSSRILRDLYEGLVGEAADGSLVPGAAESWAVSPNGEIYTFNIRRAHWSNGDPLTAQDFVYGLKRSVDPKTLSDYAQILAPIKNAEAIIAGKRPASDLMVQAIDDQTLEIILKSPTPYFLGLLTHSSTYPVHQASVEQHGGRFSRPGKLVSNGAYSLKEWTVQSHIKVVRNEHYWNNANTTIDEVYYYPTEDQSTELKRYRANELDLTEAVPVKQLDWIRNHLSDDLVISPYLGAYYFGFNLTKPPFKDNLPLRLALSMAVDRDIITKQVVGGGETPAYGWVPPIPGYEQQQPEWASWTQAKRLEKAKQLLKQAGYDESNPLEVTLLYNTNENHKRVSVAVAQMWQQLGAVTTVLYNQEWKVFLDTRRKREETEVFRAGWIGDYLDPYTFAEIMHSEHGLNDEGYNSAAYDQWLAQAATQADASKRMQLLANAEQQLLADHPIMPLYFYMTKRLVKPWLQGYTPNLMDHHYSKHFKIIAH